MMAYQRSIAGDVADEAGHQHGNGNWMLVTNILSPVQSAS